MNSSSFRAGGHPVINAASHILKNLFFPELDDMLARVCGITGFALSPVTPIDGIREPGLPGIDVNITFLKTVYTVLLRVRGLGPEGAPLLERYAGTLPSSLKLRLGTLFRRALLIDVSVVEPGGAPPRAYVGRYAAVRLICRDSGDEASADLSFPISLLSYMHADVLACDDGESLEKIIMDFFREPLRLFPDLPVLLAAFDDIELQRLLLHLMQKRLLSTYQLCLLVRAVPEEALRVKRCLSANVVRDVVDMARKFRTGKGIGRRDLMEGVYSIEDAVYRLMVAGADFRYSSMLRELQSAMSSVSSLESFLRRDFPGWLALMEEESLLYHVLSASRERDVALAFSGALAGKDEMLGRNLSFRRAGEILALSEVPSPADERLAARIRLIATYRALRIKRRSWGAESFEYLLRCMKGAPDFRRLLLETGWFTLSTALKNAKAVVKKVTEHLPAPARFLIEDVLRGVINPDILHDELQVDAARRRCVEAIIALEEEGVIDLDR